MAAGAKTPVLAAQGDLLPANRVLAKPGSEVRLKQAIYVAGMGGFAPGRVGNPLTGGTLSMLGESGPFLFKMGDKKDISAGPKNGQGAAASQRGLDRKGKAPADQPTLGLATFGAPDAGVLPGVLDKGKAPADLPSPDLAAWPDAENLALHDGEPPCDADHIVLSDSESLPDLNEPACPSPAKKIVTYYRRSERIKKLQDGVRIGSVERASQRKASTAGDSDSSSVGSASTRRRKTRKLPDINANIMTLAPLPVTEKPQETSTQTLMDLARCCGLNSSDLLADALKLQDEGATSGHGTPHG